MVTRPRASRSLLDIPSLDEIERSTVGSVVQEVGQSMAQWRALKPTKSASVIERAPSSEQVFPVSFEISQPQQAPCRARSISQNALSIEATSQLSPNWLVELTLNCVPAPITMLANVRSCTKVGDLFEVSLQPFALAGTAKQQWIALLDEARRQVSLAMGA